MIAPYVTVKVATPLGVQVHARQAGALLPEGVLPESIAHHLKKKMIEKIEVVPAAPEPEQEEPESRPPFDQGGVLPPAVGSMQVSEEPQGAAAREAGVEVDPEPDVAPSAGKVNSRSSKGDLVEHAVTQGMAREDAEGLTRDELLDLYVRKQPETPAE